MRLGPKFAQREARRSKVPATRVLWVVLLLGAIVGFGAVLKARKVRTTQRGPVIDVTDAPVAPGEAPAGASDRGLPVAGTASADGGLGAAAAEV